MAIKWKRSAEWANARPQRLASKEPFQALVIGVPDGDTLHVSRDWDAASFSSSEFVRLAGIDAPEMRSRDIVGAVRAQAELHRFCFQHVVTVRPRRIWRDPYYRIIADVSFEGADAGAWLIEHGFAQALRKHKAGTKPMSHLSHSLSPLVTPI